MANYRTQIKRRLRFSVNRKWNEVVVERSLRLSTNRRWNEVVVERSLRVFTKRRRDEWIERFDSGSSSEGPGETTRKKLRFRFP